jgi:hypothetical protein
MTSNPCEISSLICVQSVIITRFVVDVKFILYIAGWTLIFWNGKYQNILMVYDVIKLIKFKISIWVCNKNFYLQTDILVISCDLITDLSLHHIANVHRTYDASVTMLLSTVPQQYLDIAPPGVRTRKRSGNTIILWY